MPRHVRRPPTLVGKVFCGREALDQGLLSKNDLRSVAWQRLFRTIYADARVRITHRTRCAAAARWLLPPDGAIAGRSAALFHGGSDPGEAAPVEVLATRWCPREHRGGLVLHVSERSPGDVVRRAGLPVTSAERTCWDAASWYGPADAVAVVDALLACHAVTVEGLRAYRASHRRRRGSRAFARVIDLADGGAESPQESRLRVRLVLAGMPRPVTQFVISHEGRFVARADMAWPELKVAVEYDGAWHDQRGQFDRDRERLNRMQAAGWVVLHVTAKRLRDDFDGFVAELRSALGGKEGLRTTS